MRLCGNCFKSLLLEACQKSYDYVAHDEVSELDDHDNITILLPISVNVKLPESAKYPTR